MQHTSLFRKEATDHQRHRLYGDVIIVQPTNYMALVAVFLVVLIGAGVFLASQSYARKETVQGYLTPIKGLTHVYAERGGTIDALYVEPGDTVTKGERLAFLKLEKKLPSGVESQAEYLASLRRELADIAERMGRADATLETEHTAAQARHASQAAQLAALNLEGVLIKERAALATGQLQAAVDLADRGHGTQRLVDQRLEALLGLKQQASVNSRAAVALQSTRADTALYIATTLPRRVATEKADLRQRREALTRQLADVNLASGYIITAPRAGIVTSVTRAEGMAALAGAPLLTIRPLDSPLIARLMVPSRAAGLLKVGQVAKIQYDAFPYQRFGVFDGTIVRVSESILTPGEIQTPLVLQEAVYLVELDLADQFVTVAGTRIMLKPGMILKADIRLEERSLVQWVFDPILSLRGKM